MKKIHLFDTTLRDGEQGIGFLMNLEQKTAIFNVLDKLKLDTIEVGMLGASPYYYQFFEQLATLAPNSEIASLTRLNINEVRQNCEMLNQFSQSRLQLLGVGSELHLNNKLLLNFDQLLDKYKDCISYLQDNYSGRPSIILEDASRGSIDFILCQIEYFLSLGINTISIADTVGCFIPEHVTQMISKIRNTFDDEIILSVHFHNDFGLATANSLAAILAGADEIQGTFLGVGERCGNTSIEELCAIVALQETLAQAYYFEAKVKAVVDASYKILDILKLPIPLHKPIIGKYAFTTAAGIHQTGIERNLLNYAYFNPDKIGRKMEFMFNDLSSKKYTSNLNTKEHCK